MNNINLIISGNLTGFSRFYASPTAGEICSEAKFDLDYRNYLTFLINTDKAYAVSFSSSTLAVSLVTRILDSFRRPGILVVSLLLPRRTKIESANNSNGQNALYQLLNDIYDKFIEKNFVNGMVNQNPAVLMQDYYTDIINNYVLSSDSSQRLINSNIDASTANKRVAYVRTAEDNVPLYLSSICRRSYEGFHHVFFSQNVGSNGSVIEEEPEEVVTYSVLVTNNNHRIPVVRLSDRIYDLTPSIGELDIDKNYTYQQVLEGASSQITAFVQNDTIEITYRFRQEERTIHFVFKDGQNDVPFDLVVPSIQYLDDNTKYNMPNENYTFLGKEITASKTICSESNNYVVKEESSRVDISRLKDGDIYRIFVEPCFTVDMTFSQPMEKTITFKRRNSARPIIVPGITSHIFQKLPGTQDEWEFIIEANGYKRVKRNVGEFIRTGIIPFLEKIPTQESVTGKTAKGISTNVRASSSPNIFNSQGGGGLVLTGIQSGSSNPVSPKKNNRKQIYVLSLLALLVLGGAIYYKTCGSDTNQGTLQEEEIQNPQDESMSGDTTTITVSFTLWDDSEHKSTKNQVKISSYENWSKNSQIISGLKFEDAIKVEKLDDGKLTYKLTYNKNIKEYPVSLKLYVKTGDQEPKTIELLQEQTFNLDNQELTICYKESEINEYYELIDNQNNNKRLAEKRYNELLNKWTKRKDTKGLKDGILFLLDKLKHVDASPNPVASGTKQKVYDEMSPSEEGKGSEEKTTDFNSTAITLETLQQLLEDPQYEKEKPIIKSRINALKNLRRGIQPNLNWVSKEQELLIKEVFAIGNDGKKNTERQKTLTDSKDQLKNIQSFDHFKKVADKIINKQ